MYTQRNTVVGLLLSLCLLAGSRPVLGQASNKRLSSFPNLNGASSAFNRTVSAMVQSATQLKQGALVPGEVLYAAVKSTSPGGLPYSQIYAFDADGNFITTFVGPKLWGQTGSVMDMAVHGHTLYVAGDFTDVTRGSQHRLSCGVSAFNRETGAWQSWQPDIHTGVATKPTISALEVVGDHLLIGGNFESVDSSDRWGFAEFVCLHGTSFPGDLTNTRLFVRQGMLEGTVTEIASSSGSVYLAGNFDSILGQTRTRAGAVSLSHPDELTGQVQLEAWNPAPNGDINVLRVDGGRLFAGGVFTWIDGAARNYVAQFSWELDSWELDSWELDIPLASNSCVRDLHVKDNVLYVGGRFQHGSYRDVAAYDVTTGEIGPWLADDGSWELDNQVSNVTVFARQVIIAASDEAGAIAAFEERQRGDANFDGTRNPDDAIFVFLYYWYGDPAPMYPELGDANNDGNIDFSDGVYLLRWLWLGDQAPPP